MAACCGCCAALRPRYKRLVDSIFPADPQDGLVKSNMDKLTFFAMKSPEKLDRIGEYLAQRVSRDVHRQRTGFVVIAMEALDTLLVTCHAHTLNLFVESFLKMVQKLLECNEPELQCLATSSFVKFANIQEDTPSYHRRYDFFIAKFSAMCHSNHSKPDVRERMRVSGLRGVQGVVRKTASDDLQTDIWESQHMEKIVPSLLFNMHDSRTLSTDAESPKDEEHPSVVAETVFRDLVCRASFGNIHSIIKPVLRHLDNHNLWDPNDFAVKCFKIIMYSVQAQYGYVVVQNLMSHLDENSKKHPKIKSGIVDVLAETVLIAAGGSIGPSVLEVFNTLLRHLRVSVDYKHSDAQRMNDEKNFQEAVINTIGEFANNLPDYQKIDIMMFVMSKVPMPSDEAQAGDSKDVLLQTMLMKTLLKVATKYKTVLMVNAFPSSFLEPLLRMSLVQDPGIRRIVQEILHTLLDRHDNSSKLRSVRPDNPDGDKVISIPKDIAQLNLTVEKAPRQDIMFMKKNGALFYWHMSENTQQINNRVDNFEALYCTLALLCIEMGGDEILIELFRLALGIQAMTCSSSLPITHKCAIHALIAAYLNLMSQLTAIPALCQHVDQVIETRKAMAPYYLPDIAFNRSNTASSKEKGRSLPTLCSLLGLDDAQPPDNLLFNPIVIGACLDTFMDCKPRGGGNLQHWVSFSSLFKISEYDSENGGEYRYPVQEPDSSELLFDMDIISEALRSSGHDTSRLSAPFIPQPVGLDSVDLTAKSLSDIHSISFDIESAASTPAMHRKFDPEDITFDSMKKVLELNPKAKEEQEAKRRQILDSFRNAPFEDIVARSEAKSQQFQDKLNEILDMISKPQESPGGTPRKSRMEEESIPLYDMQFPQLFVY